MFLNKQVSKIVKITPRQVLSWTEKGLIKPFKESTGAGTKRGYNYLNLLEFGLCKKLFSIGMGFRAVKKMISDLRNSGVIKDWGEDFAAYHKKVFEERIEHFHKLLKENPDDHNLRQNIKEIQEKFYKEPYKPKEPMGILIYCFSEGKGWASIIAWEMNAVLNLDIIREGFIQSDSSILVDIGKIKKMIDMEL